MEDYTETTKKRKVKTDWNGLIIKELRKVYKKNQMKPLKKMSTNGKEENAPWREWFDAAMAKGVVSQLPEEILTKALNRYPLASNSANKFRYADQAFDPSPPPDGYTGLLDSTNQLMPPPSTAPSFHREYAHLFPPPMSLFNPAQLSNSGPQPALPQQTLTSYPDHYMTTVPSPSSDPALLTPPESTPSEPAASFSPQECTEPSSPVPAPHIKNTDVLYQFFSNPNPPLISLPSLADVPPEQSHSNPLLTSYIFTSHTPTPTTPTRLPVPVPRIPSFSSSHSWPNSMEFSQSGDYLSEITQTLPPPPPPKEEPIEQEKVRSKRSMSTEIANALSANHFTTNGSGHAPKTESVPPEKERPDVIVKNIKADYVEALNVHATEIHASSISAVQIHQYSDIRLKEKVEKLEPGLGLETVLKLQPKTFQWKPNALEIANSLNPSSQFSPEHSSPSVKSITRANTQANSNIPPSNNINNNNNPPTNTSNSPSKVQKHVNYNDHHPPYQTPSTTPGTPNGLTSSGSLIPQVQRAVSVPARIHTPSAHLQVRSSSEYRLPTPRHPAHPAHTASPAYPSHPYDTYSYYTDGYEEEDSGNEYEVDEDSGSEEGKDEENIDFTSENKVTGFIAQEVQEANSHLVHEDPRNGVLAIDTVGILACVVDGMKDLDLRTREIASKVAAISLASCPVPLSPAPCSPPPPSSSFSASPPMVPPLHSAVPISPPPSAPKGKVINLCSLEKGYLMINEAALSYLRTLPSISILTVCGPRNIGKSFLCNLFLPDDTTEKFQSGGKEGTKGLWIFNEQLQDKTGEKSYLIVDCQGIDPSADNNSTKLLCLAWLISSVFIFKDYRNLDIEKFEVFRSVRNILRKIQVDYETPALVGLIDDDLKIPDPAKYMANFVNDKRHPEICEAVKKCFVFRTILQLPKQREADSKDYTFHTSFNNVKEQLEGWLENFIIGAKDATGPTFAKYLLECVTQLNNV